MQTTTGTEITEETHEICFSWNKCKKYVFDRDWMLAWVQWKLANARGSEKEEYKKMLYDLSNNPEK